MICVYNQEDKKRMGPKEKAFLNKFFGVSNDQEYNSEFNADNPSFKPGLNPDHSSSIQNTGKNYFDQTWEKEHQINLPSKNPEENQPPENKENAPQEYLKLNKKKKKKKINKGKRSVRALCNFFFCKYKCRTKYKHSNLSE